MNRGITSQRKEYMKRISVIALLSMLVLPSFAEEVSAPDVASTETAPEQVASANLSAEEKLKLKQEFKDEIKSELNQEYAGAKKASESKRGFLDGVQIGVGVSATSGLNGFIGYANKDVDSFWAKRFGVRFDFATTKPVKSLISDGLDSVMGDGIDIGDDITITDLDIKAQHYAALLDFYPFGDTWLLGGWRITGGYAFGDMNMSANIAGAIDELNPGFYEFELAGQKYAYNGNSVRGTAQLDWEYRGPYVGTGFDIGLFAGFKIYLDAGVVFTNRAAELSLDVPFENLQKFESGTWTPVNNDTLKAEVDKYKNEALADAQSELDDFKFYPMVKLGFMYRF